MAPRVFYRVQHNDSQVTYYPSIGFITANSLNGDPEHLCQTLDNHLVDNFENHCNKAHTPTALISVCSSQKLTLERAQHEEQVNGRRSGVLIYEIHENRETYFFHAQQFARAVEQWKGKVILRKNWRYLENEYLSVNVLPSSAVAWIWDVQGFQDCMYPVIPYLS